MELMGEFGPVVVSNALPPDQQPTTREFFRVRLSDDTELFVSAGHLLTVCVNHNPWATAPSRATFERSSGVPDKEAARLMAEA